MLVAVIMGARSGCNFTNITLYCLRVTVYGKATKATKLNTIPEVSLKNVDQITPNPLFHRRVMKKKMVQITKHGELSLDPSHRHQQAQHVQMKVVMNRRDSMNLQKTN